MASRDLTTGSIPKHLLALAVPVIGAMLLQSVYALVDLMWIKRLGEQAVAGLSINLQVFFIILSLSQVISTTAMADMSNLWGKGERDKARDAFASFLGVAVGLGLLTFGLAELGAEAYVHAFTDDPVVGQLGLEYFQVNAITFVLQLLLIVLGYGLRASGDFITPMLVMVASVLTNLVLDPLLIFGVGEWEGMGISGAAWATVVGQSVALTGYLGLLLRARGHADQMSIGKPRYTWGFFQQLLVRGVPAGTQYLLMSVVMAMSLWAMKPHGAVYTATAGGGFRVLQQAILPVVALASAAAAMSGQNMGAGLPDRIRTTSRTTLSWSLVFTLLMCGAFLLFPRFFASLFAQPEELAVASQYFRWSAPMIVGLGLSMPPTMVLQALKQPWTPLSAAMGRVGILALLILLWLIPAQAPPEWVFGAIAWTAFAEGLLGTGLLALRLRKLPGAPA
ncbi:MAG: MATE family efflux transporter [Myxococcota bacterium]|nr:MATE family efflux transporter [Myxococcota bacterium]